MKITKRRLRALINEIMVSDSPGGPFEFTKPAEDPQEETMLNSPRQAGREWSYENLADAVGDLVREALEGHGLEAGRIRDAIAEALSEELGPVEEESEPPSPPPVQLEGQMPEMWLQILDGCLDEKNL